MSRSTTVRDWMCVLCSSGTSSLAEFKFIVSTQSSTRSSIHSAPTARRSLLPFVKNEQGSQQGYHSTTPVSCVWAARYGLDAWTGRGSMSCACVCACVAWARNSAGSCRAGDVLRAVLCCAVLCRAVLLCCCAAVLLCCCAAVLLVLLYCAARAVEFTMW
jgi:hypothetical protein